MTASTRERLHPPGWTPGGTTGGGGAPPRGCGRGGCCTGGMPGADPTGFIGICAGGAPCGAPGASGIVGGPPGGIGAGCAGAASAGLASPVGGGCSSGLTASSSLTSDINLKVVPQNGAAEGGREAIDCSFCAQIRHGVCRTLRTFAPFQPISPWDTCHMRCERADLSLSFVLPSCGGAGKRESRVVLLLLQPRACCLEAPAGTERVPRHRVGGEGLLSPVAERERVAAAALSLSLSRCRPIRCSSYARRRRRETVPFVPFD